MFVLESMTIWEALEQSVAAYSDLPALRYEGREWSYAELKAQATHIGRALTALGVQKGDRIAIWSENSPQTIFALYGAMAAGAAAVMPGTGLTAPQLEAALRQTGCTLLLYGSGYKQINFAEEAGKLPGEFRALPLAEYERWAAPETVASAKVSPDDTALILFTSGTGSAPKAVMSSHQAWVNIGRVQAEDMRMTARDRVCAALPLFHCFCLSSMIFSAMRMGACVCLPKNSRTATILQVMQEERCTVFCAVPTLFSALTAREDFADWDLSSLRIGLIGGASYTPEQFDTYRRMLGFDLLPSLGQSEATAGITVAAPEDSDEVKACTLGRFMRGIEGRIAHPTTDTPLPEGEIGEIQIRGYSVMQGYCGAPELTASAITPDGWLRTGDLGRIRPDGNIAFEGRRKELIIRGGENVSPAQLERCLMASGRYREIKVLGVPDAHYGEEICACAVPLLPEEHPEETLRTWIATHLEVFKVPRYVLLLPELPKNSAGKISVSQLRKLIESMLNGDE